MRIGELSARTGVSSHLLRVWERRYGLLQPRRSAGNVRLYSALDEARVRVMKRHLQRRVPASQAAELARAAPLSIKPGKDGRVIQQDALWAAERMSRALARFDESAAEQALQQILASYAASAVIRDVLLPHMHEVGVRWAAGHATVAQEHFASSFVFSRLLALARGWDRGLGPRAVLACAPDDYHAIALTALGVALHRLGWRITYLGAATPVPTLISAAEQVGPELVVVSSELDGGLDEHLPELREVAERWRLGLGGRGVVAAHARSCGAQHLVGDPVSVAAALAVSQGPAARSEPPTSR